MSFRRESNSNAPKLMNELLSIRDFILSSMCKSIGISRLSIAVEIGSPVMDVNTDDRAGWMDGGVS